MVQYKYVWRHVGVDSIGITGNVHSVTEECGDQCDI